MGLRSVATSGLGAAIADASLSIFVSLNSELTISLPGVGYGFLAMTECLLQHSIAAGGAVADACAIHDDWRQGPDRLIFPLKSPRR